MAKKSTPGKGGAKGMHKGHEYKESCNCVICKSKRKKLEQALTDGTPTFERTERVNETVIKVVYRELTNENWSGTFDEETGVLTVVIADKFKKEFKFSKHDVNTDNSQIITSVVGEVLTILVPKKETPLTDETVKQFVTEETKTVPIQPKQPEVKEPEPKPTTEEPVNLKGEITIEENTYEVMNKHVDKLARIFNLQKGFDQNKFINELVNKSIIHFCNTVK